MSSSESDRFFRRLGKRCKEIRFKRGLTQEDMANYGFSTRFYQRIEAGKPIHLKTAIKLAKVFQLTLSELFKGL